MGAYLDKLKASSSPESYQKLIDLLSYNGVGDEGAQIFTRLDTSGLNAPKNIEPSPPVILGYDDAGSPMMSSGGQQRSVGTVNGIPVTANYDAEGNLTGYSGDRSVRQFLSGNQSYSGQWDANGNPVPQGYASSGGGFASGLVGDIAGGLGDVWQSLGPIGQVAALYYGGSALGEALGAAAPAAEAAPSFTGALPEGFSTTLPAAGPGVQLAGGDTATALGSLASPENAYTAAQDAQDALAMTGNPAANASLTGVAAIGAGNAYPALNAAAAGEAAAAGMTPAQIAAAAGAGKIASGTSLSDILPYTTGATVAGSLLSANAAQKAADTQTAAANAAIAQQQKNFETISQQQAPYRATGYNALNEIAKLGAGQTPQYDYQGNIVKDASGNPVMTTGSGYLTHQFTPEDFAAGIDPGYAFRLQQGQMANQRAANVAGGALSGNTLKGLQDYTQGLASTEYGNAFNRYQTQRQNIYNTLANIAGIGQTGQTATNTAATNATNAATQLGVGSAAAQAAGGVGSAQAYTNAINQGANNYTLASLLNQRGNVAMPVQG